MQAVTIDAESCWAFQRAAELAGKKWNAAVLLAIGRGAERFSEILRAIDGISARLLTARLRELERHGLIERDAVATASAHPRYRLTPSGADLLRVLRPLVEWSRTWMEGVHPSSSPRELG